VRNKDLGTASPNFIEVDNKDYSKIATSTTPTLDAHKGNVNTQNVEKKI
jgi:hypothetical protein